MDITRICSKCNTEFALTTKFFGRRKTGLQGFQSICKLCYKAYKTKAKHDNNGLRICSCCKTAFPSTLDYFNKNKNYDDGMDGKCRKCYGYEFRPRIDPRPGYKFCNTCGEELPKTRDYFFYGKQSGWFGSCKECINKQHKEYYHENIDQQRERGKEYGKNHKEEISLKNKLRRLNNLEHDKEVKLNYYYNNKPKIRARVNKRYREDIQFNLETKMRARIRLALKSREITKSHKCIELLGCTYQFYQSYFEVCFKDGMTWGLYLSGDIVADHIKPLPLFDLTDEKQLMAFFNWSNTTPMWKEENEDKNSYYEGKLHRRPKTVL
jgi:hypothetical protein